MKLTDSEKSRLKKISEIESSLPSTGESYLDSNPEEHHQWVVKAKEMLNNPQIVGFLADNLYKASLQEGVEITDDSLWNWLNEGMVKQ